MPRAVAIGNLDTGSTADVTGRTNDGEWLQIDFNDQRGWVAFFVVTLTGSLDNIAVASASADAATETPQSSGIEIVTRYNLNLHEQPSPDAPVLTIVPFNTTLRATARSDESASWLSVTFDCQAGWLMTPLISAKADLGNLPIVSSQ